MMTSLNTSNQLTHKWLARSSKIFTLLWFALVAAVIALGWWLRNEGYLVAENGAGYWLGIIGGSLMLLLLTYSLRKRVRFLKRALPVKWWFQMHMALGVIGPVCILFHSNFHLGSLNSNVALVCMLLVAASGIIGRYIYTRIHTGLYGERIRLRETLAEFRILFSDLSALAVTQPQRKLAEDILKAVTQIVTEAEQKRSVSRKQNRQRIQKINQDLGRLVNSLEQSHKTLPATVELTQAHTRLQEDYQALLLMLRKIPGLELFERMFSLWHIIHIPIFVLMIITAIIHVVVVHMY